ncbi:CRAL-TRIO domain [Macleaya cordata]|uniref:CRAL-TRIO domain n=1 Tax=Macleaya cordata TaxID=56857 RepID=A0A200QKB4_MACCD|nr:CRAL-TRIO domain [Macleaya cordata]
MAEETKAPAAPAAEVVVVSEAAAAPSVEPTKEPTKECVPAVEETAEKEKATEEVVAVAETEETEKPKEEEEGKIEQSDSFKEESTIVADLEDPEKKALDELKQLIQQALNKHEFTSPPPKPEEKKPEAEEEKPEEKKPEEEEKPEEKKPEEEEKPVEEEKKAACEETHVESTTKEPESTPEPVKEVKKEEEKSVAAPEPPVEKKAEPVVEVVAKVVEAVSAKVVEAVSAAVVVDDDGAKTVEAIEETIVAVQSTKEPESSTPSDPAAESSCAVVEETVVETVVIEEEEVPPPPPEEVSIYGIPLLADERSDVILQKFLRARDFKVKEAFTMIKNVVRWRKEFGIEELLEEDLGNDFEKVVFMDGVDKEGHPVCYNVFGEFSNKDLQKTFTAEKFLRWRIQFLEKSIRKLDFTPGGISTLVQVNDLKNSPGPFQKELRVATNQAVTLLQDNYPEFVAKQIFVNVPWWYLAFNRMISPFLTLRTKSKFVFAGPSKSADTLFKYVAPEQVPVQFGGLNKEGEHEFSTADSVTEITIKPASKQTVEFPVSETCTLVWELRVVGWEVSYGAEFVPDAEDGYTVIVSKTRKLTPTDEPVLCTSFKIGEPGKVVLTIDNPTSKKKKLLYRSKTKSSSD